MMMAAGSRRAGFRPQAAAGAASNCGFNVGAQRCSRDDDWPVIIEGMLREVRSENVVVSRRLGVGRASRPRGQEAKAGA